jgi:pimeloyl-ACP methyl ester carboxylesterase
MCTRSSPLSTASPRDPEKTSLIPPARAGRNRSRVRTPDSTDEGRVARDEAKSHRITHPRTIGLSPPTHFTKATNHQPLREITATTNPSAAQRVPVTTADGLSLATTQIGPETADLTVIFLHGLMGDSGSWRCQTSHLTSSHSDICVVAYNHRGHGRSGRGGTRSNTLGQLARDLDAVIDATTPTGHIVLIGHSMGAMTILQYLQHQQARNIDRIAGVGLIAPAAADITRYGLGRMLATRLVASACALAIRSPASVEAVRTTAVRATEPIWRRVTKNAPTLAAIINAPQLPILAGFLESISHFDGTAAFRTLTGTPTLVMCGTGDLVTPRRHSAAISAAVPEAELVVVPDAGHMLMLERPAVVNERLDALLERARIESAPRPPKPERRAIPAAAHTHIVNGQVITSDRHRVVSDETIQLEGYLPRTRACPGVVGSKRALTGAN